MRIILFLWLFYQLNFCTPSLVLKNAKDRTFLVCTKVCYNYSISVFHKLILKINIKQKESLHFAVALFLFQGGNFYESKNIWLQPA